MGTERQVVLISGGSRGLGAGLVADLLDRGHAVATFSRSSSPFIEQRQAADPTGESFVWEPLDAMDFDRVSQFAMQAAQRFGRIDALINNAAVSSEGVLALLRPADIHRLLGINLEGAVRLAQTCARVMLKQRSGVIINVTSIVGLTGISGLSVYSATKAALDGLTRSLARELGPRNIRVNSVAPGYLDTEMTTTMTPEHQAQLLRRTPLQRLGTVDDVVGVVRFLLSRDASFITGQTLVVDGGTTC